MDRSFPGRFFIHLILIAVLGLLVYSNTFHVPFQWDEDKLLVENPVIKDLSYFLEPLKAKEYPEYGIFKRRYISFLTFALNYRAHGFDVTGYHTVNLFIHIFNALLVYFLVVLTFRTPFLSKSSLKELSRYIALFTGLLFVSHPVQTEAVTYVMQRFASLVTFFYLLSLALYIKWRLTTSDERKRPVFYMLCLVSAVLAMKTKENSLTLPFAIILYEFLFFSGSIKKRTLPVIPLFLLLIIFPLVLTETGLPVEKVLFGVDSEAGGYITKSAFDKDYLYPSKPRQEYFITQFRVIVTYLRLLFLPVNQNLLYDYPLFKSLFNPQVFLSFLFLLFLLGFAVYIYYLSRFGYPDLRLVAFGIFWFFLTLSVESSIIPIPLIIAEYRLYLPSVGVFLAILSGGGLLIKTLNSQKAKTVLVTFLVLLLLVFSAATYARNSLWGSKVSLWRDVVRKSPQKVRGHNNLGNVYLSQGLTDKAIEHFQIAVRLRPDYAKAHYNLGNAYHSKSLVDKAIKHYKTALRLKPDSVEAHTNLGNAYYSKGMVDKAVVHSQIALRLKPDSVEAHTNLGNAYYSKGMVDKAIKHYKTALRMKPDYAKAHNNLGNAYKVKGLIDSAIEHYKAALRMKPDYTDAHFNLGLAYLKHGQKEKARREFEAVLRLKPEDEETRQLLNRIVISLKGQ